MAKPKHKNFITPVMRTSFTSVFEQVEALNGDMVYQTALLIPKDDEEGIKDIKSAIISAAKERWGDDKSKWPKPFINPLHDGDAENRKDISSYHGCLYLNAKTKFKPGVVGANLKPIIDEEEFYSGVYCRAEISFYTYSKAGNTGVGVSLNNLMKVKDGERLDGKQSAEKAFASFKVEDEEVAEESGDADDEFFDG